MVRMAGYKSYTFNLGFGKFLPTLGLFKALFLGFHLGNCWLIYRIFQAPAQKKFALALYGLNPMIITESLVSPHNEVMMLFFVLLGYFFLKRQKYFRSVWIIIIVCINKICKHRTISCLDIFPYL